MADLNFKLIAVESATAIKASPGLQAQNFTCMAFYAFAAGTACYPLAAYWVVAS